MMGLHTRDRVRRRYMMVGEEVTRDDAYRAVRKAIREGTLVPQPCEVCGRTTGRIEAHHANGYERALDVTWLCWVHHGQAHQVMRHSRPPLGWTPIDAPIPAFSFHSKSRPSHLLTAAVRAIEFMAARGYLPELRMLAVRLAELTGEDVA